VGALDVGVRRYEKSGGDRVKSPSVAGIVDGLS
jgi:hypothetical protein